VVISEICHVASWASCVGLVACLIAICLWNNGPGNILLGKRGLGRGWGRWCLLAFGMMAFGLGERGPVCFDLGRSNIAASVVCGHIFLQSIGFFATLL
jgi:hypothetical protein